MVRTKLTISAAVVSAVSAVTVLAGTATIAEPATAADGYDNTYVAYRDSDWTYRQVAHGALRHFQDGDYADNHFREHGQAGFGTTDHGCPWNTRKKVRTPWTPGTDLLLRHTVYLPDQSDPLYAGPLHVSGSVDDSVDVYLNGDFVGHVDGNACEPGLVDLTVPGADPGFNVLALRATDDGGSSYIDVKVTGYLYYED